MSWFGPSLVLLLQARPTFKGLVNCIYKLCPAILYSVVWSHYNILSHDTLHQCLSNNNGLEKGDRELGQLFCYYGGCKNSLTILHRERAHFATGYIIWNLVTSYIPGAHNLYTQFTRPCPFLQKWVWLARLVSCSGNFSPTGKIVW